MNNGNKTHSDSDSDSDVSASCLHEEGEGALFLLRPCLDPSQPPEEEKRVRNTDGSDAAHLQNELTYPSLPSQENNNSLSYFSATE